MVLSPAIRLLVRSMQVLHGMSTIDGTETIAGLCMILVDERFGVVLHCLRRRCQADCQAMRSGMPPRSIAMTFAIGNIGSYVECCVRRTVHWPWNAERKHLLKGRWVQPLQQCGDHAAWGLQKVLDDVGQNLRTNSQKISVLVGWELLYRELSKAASAQLAQLQASASA